MVQFSHFFLGFLFIFYFCCAWVKAEIVKSEHDHRNYKLVTLNNGMRVLLISDEKSDRSAASLTVNVGYMEDPWELPGLAHFLEHMLFMGTEKYPDEGSFPQFLVAHAGRINARTTSDQTSYYFDVSAAYFDEALERFSQFFIAPLFKSDTVNREIDALDSEYSNKFQCEGCRLFEVEKIISNQNHPYTKFGTGSKVKLFSGATESGISLRDHVMKFYKENYSANIMGLAVLGNQTIQDLQSLVTSSFSGARNTNQPLKEWVHHPVGPSQINQMISVVPVTSIQELKIIFPIPDSVKDYKSNQYEYVAVLVGYEGPGSVESELKRLDFGNSVSVGSYRQARGFGKFEITVELTENGEQNLEEIVLLFFQYLKLVKADGIQEWRHREFEAYNDVSFRYKDEEQPRDYVLGLSSKLFDYPEEDLLQGPYMMPDYNPELIRKLLSNLVPSNMNLIYVSKLSAPHADLTEPNYQTNYSAVQLSSEFLEKCRNVELNPAFHLPLKNPFIPENFRLIVTTNDSPLAKTPNVVIDKPGLRLWHLPTARFDIPKSEIYIRIYSNLANLNPKNRKKDLMDFFEKYPRLQASQYLTDLLSKKSWTMEELLDATDGLDIDLLKRFISNFWSSTYIEMFVAGNTAQQDAIKVADVISKAITESQISSKNLAYDNIERVNVVDLPKGNRFWYEKINNNSDNSAILVYLQFGVQETMLNALAFLSENVVCRRAFTQLRTKEQLGYVVGCGSWMWYGSVGMYFGVQSRYNPEFLESRIDAFLQDSKDIIHGLSEEEFSDHKNSIITPRLEEMKTLSELGDKVWREIYWDRNFQRDELEVNAVRQITKQGLLKFYEENVSDCKKRLSVLVTGRDAQKPPDNNDVAFVEAHLIDNIAQFQATVPIYNRPKPFLDLH